MREIRKKLLVEMAQLDVSHLQLKSNRQSRYLSSREQSLAEKEYNLNQPIMTCLQLLNFFLKYEGRRPATECIPSYRKNTRYISLNMFPNITSFKFCDNGTLKEEQSISYYVWHRHTLSTNETAPSAKIVESVFMKIRKISDTMTDAVTLYDRFCDWLVRDLCSRYLPEHFKRIVVANQGV